MRLKLEVRETKNTGATFDLSGHYRYELWRSFDTGKGTVSFVMLNPNRADESVNDPTITRCERFARDWGFNRLSVVNLFAYRAKTPRELMKADNPIGNLNDKFVLSSIKASDLTILAWGNYGGFLSRSEEIVRMTIDKDLAVHCLAVNASGEPKHPLYIARTAKPVRYISRV